MYEGCQGTSNVRRAWEAVGARGQGLGCERERTPDLGAHLEAVVGLWERASAAALHLALCSFLRHTKLPLYSLRSKEM